MEEIKEEIKKIKEMFLIDILGIYTYEDINKVFDENLQLKKKYVEEHKNELPDRSVSNNLKH